MSVLVDGSSGGRVAGKAEIITNSAQLGLELGLSLAMFNDIIGVYLVRVFTQMARWLK